MRIAVIGSRGIPARYSGIERAVEAVAQRLALKGHEVTVYARFSEYAGDEFESVKLIHLPTWNGKCAGTFIHVLLATMVVVFSSAQVVHYHALGPSFFALLPRLFGKRVIVTIHGLDWKRKKWGILARLFLRLCQYPAIYFPHRTIVVSNVLKEYFEKKFRKSVDCVPNGAGPVSCLGLKEAVRNDCKQSGYILFVGRLVPEKGIQYLIKAFNEVETDRVLVLAGESSFTDNYVKSLKSISGSKIRFLGFVDGKHLELLYQNAYMVVLPSEIEGSPLVLLEAMHYGKCVLSSDLPECREVLGSDGEYFRSSDTVSLRDKLCFLLESGEVVREYGQKARIRAEALYNWDSISKDMERIYSGEAL